MSSVAVPTTRSKAVSVGIVTAIVMTVLSLIGALWNPISSLLPALLFLVVTFGLVKGRPWSGYGGALFLIAMASGSLLSALGLSHQGTSLGLLSVAALLHGLAAFLLYRAGRSLGPAMGTSGLPWIVLALATFAGLIVFRPFTIPAGSMEDTLLIGDHILVRMVGLPAPARGELVVFRSPGDSHQILIKRIVAIGGDKIQLKNKKLFLNGSEQQEPFATHKMDGLDEFRDNFPQEPNTQLANPDWGLALKRDTKNGELVVPPGKLFVMGDNREMSLDSRYFGYVEATSVVGKPQLIYFSVNLPTESLISTPSAEPPILSGKVRWDRLFTPVK